MKTIEFNKDFLIPLGYNVVTHEFMDDKSNLAVFSEDEKIIYVSHHLMYKIAFSLCNGWDDISDTAKFCCNIAKKRIAKMIDRWS